LSYTADADPLCYPGTNILINLLDIRDADLLDEAELAFFLARAEEPFPEGGFDSAHYLALHRHLFQDVYSWAGHIRTIRTGKGGNWFCYPDYIGAELDRVFDLLGDPARSAAMTADEFADHAGHFLAELNAVHPFREGNGRTQLVFLAMLADLAGFGFNEKQLEPDRVMHAMVRSFLGDEDPLKALVRDIVG
jgi:cell filamentation protein